ncbi:winged helix-turn-helix transcriptional regulator [Methanolobus sp.]|jgi:predicted transcriptional regulator|uniref:winged helix-turn-helix transcriptional regulator n=1 Tax=Methanolobus sp. TaxID=1874737 RepID=UPI0025D4CAFC|nr:winged helix-turn-helix transcriptional regulator [Methanolobus sp.]
MEDQNENSIDELLIWVITVDRRLILMKSMRSHNVITASDIARETNRSTQNISRALRELESNNLIMCLTPDKSTWKKYILTGLGKKVLQKMEDTYL